MISSISSSSGIQYQLQMNSNVKLTDEQKKQVNDIISQYDPENMSQDDVKSMFDEIKKLGIGPSEDLKSILDTAGFKPPEKPQGPPPENNVSSNQSQQMLEILEKVKSGEITEDDIDSFIKSLQESGQLTQGNLVNKTA